MRTRIITLLAYEGVQPLDVVGPFEVFAGANEVLAARGQPAGYDVRLVAPTGAVVRGESGLGLACEPLSSAAGRAHTLMIAGGFGVYEACDDRHLVDWVRSQAALAERVATVCTGAFLAAAAGLLDGRTVTTHWARSAELARRHPELRVEADNIYLQDGTVWTSAGVTAGIDLALALVSDDVGTDVAQMVARWLVMFVHRPGGQTQFATPVWMPRGDREVVRHAQERIEQRPGDDHRLPTLAHRACMSVRHFARVFTEQVGESPGAYVQRVRIQAARDLLESSDSNVDVVAASVGFGTAESLRRAFHRQLGVSPDAYRRRFRTAS